MDRFQARNTKDTASFLQWVANIALSSEEEKGNPVLDTALLDSVVKAARQLTTDTDCGGSCVAVRPAKGE